ncbi:MAG: hypothetical protein AUK07_01000 [Parcubacteria group bacterium CG2_30_36_21]|nr:MAG: hypothetical protein AUK07_01000 [Parcubacteria group bacterium CG2_30_36_21]
MEISEHLLEKMEKEDEVTRESKRIEEKLASSDVPEGKKEKLRYRQKILRKKLRREQNTFYL